MLYIQKATQVTFSADHEIEYLAGLYAYPDAPDRPWVRANMVTTLDGATAVEGTSGGLGGPGDKTVFRVLRGLADVVLVGARTALTEDYRQPAPDAQFGPRRTANGQAPAPALALVSRSLALDLRYGPLTHRDTTVLTCRSADPQRRRQLTALGARVVDCGADTVDPAEVIAYFARIGQRRVLCEGGPRLLGSVIAADVLDELCLTISPNVAAGDAARIAHTGDDGRLHGLRAAHILTDDDGFIFSRWTR
ncbi:MAG: pyrimidine reductase family protein [Gordonia sp. (in: high G+C Gram-positive bacteria)]